MKTRFLLMVISILLVISCSDDFLNLTPQSSITNANFFTNKDQFDQAMIGAYASLKVVFGGRASWVMGEMRSDNTFYAFNDGNRGPQYLDMEFTDNFLDDGSSEIIPEKWTSCYVGISRCNKIIDELSSGQKDYLSQDDLDSMIGQSKFIRALLYFNLVRYFGGVPLYIAPVANVGNAYQPRASVDDVYTLIIDDLNDAIQKLGSPTFPQVGRASKGSARMLLADVYLTRHDYKSAESQLNPILQMGYGLLPDYASVFDLSHENSIESLFEVQFQDGVQGLQTDIPYPWMPLSDDVGLITGFQGAAKYAGWNKVTQEMIDSYESGDRRLEASIEIIEGTGVVENMVIEEVKSPIGYTTPPDKISYAFIKKLLTPHSMVYNTGVNMPIYRYSEALLSMAEVKNELNIPSEALPFLNEVRTRAGLTTVNETDQSLLREIIAHERRVELAFENKRWLDLVRTEKAIEVMTNNGEYLKPKNSFLPDNSYVITPDKLIFPIPDREIQVGNLEQNP
jgi:hypothetical protein